MSKVETRIFIALQVVLIIVMAIIAVSLLGSSSIGGFLSGTAGAADNVDSSYVSWLIEQREEIQAQIDELEAEIEARNQEIADLTEVIFRMWEDGARQDDLDVFYAQLDALIELNKWDLLFLIVLFIVLVLVRPRQICQMIPLRKLKNSVLKYYKSGWMK